MASESIVVQSKIAIPERLIRVKEAGFSAAFALPAPLLFRVPRPGPFFLDGRRRRRMYYTYAVAMIRW